MNEPLPDITMTVTRSKIPLRDRLCSAYTVGADCFQSNFQMRPAEAALWLECSYVRQHREHKPDLVCEIELYLRPLVEEPDAAPEVLVTLPITRNSDTQPVTLAEQVEKVQRGEAPADSLRGTSGPAELVKFQSDLDAAAATEQARAADALVAIIDREVARADPRQVVTDSILADYIAEDNAAIDREVAREKSQGLHDAGSLLTG